jgi:hypothetical protein
MPDAFLDRLERELHEAATREAQRAARRRGLLRPGLGPLRGAAVPALALAAALLAIVVLPLVLLGGDEREQERVAAPPPAARTVPADPFSEPLQGSWSGGGAFLVVDDEGFSAGRGAEDLTGRLEVLGPDELRVRTEGGGCLATPARYAWRVEGRRLRLDGARDPCAARRAILEAPLRRDAP